MKPDVWEDGVMELAVWRFVLRLAGPVVIGVMVLLSSVAQQPEPPIEENTVCMDGVCPDEMIGSEEEKSW